MATSLSPQLIGYPEAGPRVHRVAALAETFASALGHDGIGPLHLALGILHEGRGVAVSALEVHGFSVPELRAAVEGLLSRMSPTSKTSCDVALTAEGHFVLTAAYAEARALGHRTLATEHLLLGLLSAGSTAFAALLAQRGFDLTQARECIGRIFEGDPPATTPQA